VDIAAGGAGRRAGGGVGSVRRECAAISCAALTLPRAGPRPARPPTMPSPQAISPGGWPAATTPRGGGAAVAVALEVRPDGRVTVSLTPRAPSGLGAIAARLWAAAASPPRRPGGVSSAPPRSAPGAAAVLAAFADAASSTSASSRITLRAAAVALLFHGCAADRAPPPSRPVPPPLAALRDAERGGASLGAAAAASVAAWVDAAAAARSLGASLCHLAACKGTLAAAYHPWAALRAPGALAALAAAAPAADADADVVAGLSDLGAVLGEEGAATLSPGARRRRGGE